MQIPSWLAKLVLLASILTAIATNLTTLNPVYGVVALAVAGVLTAFSDSFKSFVVPQGVTIAGLLLVAGAVLSYVASPENGGVFSFITPAKLVAVGQVGAILTTIGEKLRMGSGATAGLLVFALVLPGISSACKRNPDPAARKAGYWASAVFATGGIADIVAILHDNAVVNGDGGKKAIQSLDQALIAIDEIGVSLQTGFGVTQWDKARGAIKLVISAVDSGAIVFKDAKAKDYFADATTAALSIINLLEAFQNANGSSDGAAKSRKIESDIDKLRAKYEAEKKAGSAIGWANLVIVKLSEITAQITTLNSAGRTAENNWTDGKARSAAIHADNARRLATW